MAYYQGDYYQGDYYQGDPFIGALLGGAVSWLGKKIFKRGLSPAAQARAGSMVLRKGGTFAKAAVLPAAGIAAATGMTIPLPGPFRMDPSAVFPGGRPFISREPPAMAVPTAAPGMAMGACCPSGYHIAKDGTGRCVRNRSMNVANPRALRRSLRRVAGFGKLAQRSKRDIRRAAKAIGA